MSVLQTLGKGQGYLKAGLLGFPKSGKTFTAAKLAIGTRAMMGLKGPIAIVDTEGGAEYIAPMVERETGQPIVGIQSRRFEDLMAAARECVESGVAVLIVDSITHIWRGLCDAYLKGVNERRRERGWTPKTSLEFQDWNQVKGAWQVWPDFFLNSPLHIIICGRAGFEYDMEKDEETGKRELVKTGTKMKVESEFGFEPSLLVEMQREQVPAEGGFKFIRRAMVLGDRFNLIDGKSQVDPTFEFFKPHVAALKPHANPTVTTSQNAMEVDESGDPQWAAEKKARTILAEEIQGALVSAIPGQSADDKKKKADLLQEFFGTRSWTAVESTESGRLRAGLKALKVRLGLADAKPETKPEAKEDEVPMEFPKPGAEKPGRPAPVVETTPTKPVEIESQATRELPLIRPEPTPEPKPAKPTNGKASAEQVQAIMVAIPEQFLGKSVAWMVHNGWLTSEQAMADNPFEHLKPVHAKRVLEQVDNFLLAIGAK